jgi:sulfate adenylyltransferase large subunit
LTSLTHDLAPRSFAEFLEQDLNTELLRFTTAGSVDDGKSTLIGRLLHDSKAVYEDQLASVKKSRINRSSGPIDFSLLTDGLRAEREQGITIDVAYRYFATARRKFIIADTPGHEQYTRNMATGASTADLAVILMDATKGILAQTRRHAFIASLLGIKNVLAAVNKMDLVDYREDVFVKLEQDFLRLAEQLGIRNVQCVPISALAGDNVVDRSARTGWYAGPTLLEHLETVPLPSGDETASLRFPVQTVIRPDAGFRGFAGRIARGTIRPGDEVVALPSGRKTRVQEIVSYDGNLAEAFAPMSVTLQLEDEIDLSRGDMLVAAESLPRVSRKFEAMVVWLHGTPLEVGRSYLVKHTARQTKIRALKIRHRVNVNTLAQEHPARLEMNDIASVEFEANVPLFFDAYSEGRTTGSFILIDPISNATVGAGMIQEDLAARPGLEAGEDGISSLGLARPQQAEVAPQERYQRHGHYPAVLLLENRPELAGRVERALFQQGFEVLHWNAAGIAPAAVIDIVRVAKAAGLVAIYSADVLSAETKRVLASEATDRVFDAAAADLSTDDELFLQVVTFTRSLLLEAPGDDRNRVN